MMNRVLLIGLLIQFFLAGVGAFGAADYSAHALTGWLLLLVALISAVFASFAPLSVAQRGTAGVLAVIICLQPVLALVIRPHFPYVAAMHVVNAGVAAILAWKVEGMPRAVKG